jgi:hypothetical protein
MTERKQVVRRRARTALWLGIVLAAIPLAKRDSAARPPDIVFSPPTDSVNVAGVIPLGSLNPQDGHVLAVDHNYLVYPVPFSDGVYAYPVRAMAAGSIVMLFRQPLGTSAGSVPDYGIYIQHSRSLTSYVIHVHELSSTLDAHVAGASWTTIRPGFDILLLGQGSAPPLLSVAAGADLGVTRSYTGAWDVGVIDTSVRNDLLGRGPRRYPTLQDYADSLGLAFDPPYRGHQTRNAACFIDYLEAKDQTDWFFKLTSDPISCGRAGWDVAGTIRGAWFSQSIDAGATVNLFALQTGVLSVIPDNLRPDTYVQIGIGAGTYSPIDPDDTMDQLDNPFKMAIDFTPGGSINPDPASVGIRDGTVCYDLSYGGGSRYDRLLVRLVDRDRLRVRYDAVASATPSCAGPLPDPDATWAEYVR